MDVNSSSLSILSSEVPLVIRNKISKWQILKYSEKEWCEVFQGQKLRFRKGHKNYKECPFWESSCEEEFHTLEEFFKISTAEKVDDSTWLYFDYKYMKDVFKGNPEILKAVKWSELGLSDFSGEDSTIWIGNTGAHTPCHMDTYGCNVVAQLYGRKMWILIPPEASDSLEPTRVPYEESSVYSNINFYTPSEKILGIEKAYKVVLNPGDVLFVPRHWWHYVENLSTAVSVNTWLPLNVDHESRLEEALVRNYIYNTCNDLTEEDAKNLLNPNEYDLLSESVNLQMFRTVIENCKTYRNSENAEITGEAITNCEIQKLESFNSKEMNRYLHEKRKAHGYGPDDENSGKGTEMNKHELSKLLIDSFCSPTNLKSIKETLLKNYELKIRSSFK